MARELLKNELHMNYPITVSNPEATTYLIIVMGVSGCGKTTLAQSLAMHYGYTCLDADDFHSPESRDLMAQGIPLTDAQRDPWVAAIKYRLEKSTTTTSHVVLAFSGLKQKHRNKLREAGLRTLFLFLNGTPDAIQSRLNKRQGHFMAPQLLESQFESLENPLLEADVYLVDTQKKMDEVFTQAISIVDNALPGKKQVSN